MIEGNKDELIARELEASAEVILLTSHQMTEKIRRACEFIIESLRLGGGVFLIGNGGSAADAQHLAADLVGRFRIDKKIGLKALALTTDTSVLTAIANDFGFDQIFSKQVEALASPGDILIALSTSGNSENVITAARNARSRNMVVISLTGRSGGELRELSDVNIAVPSEVVSYIQQAHIAIGHTICCVLEKEFDG